MTRLFAQQRKPSLDRILADLLEQFVDESLHRKAGMGVADRPPPERRDGELDVMGADFQVRDRVGQVRSTFDGGFVEIRLAHDRLADDHLFPGGDLTLRIDGATHPVGIHRAIR
jgi:hypothetical protein